MHYNIKEFEFEIDRRDKIIKKLKKEVKMCNTEASNIALWLFNKFFFHKPDMVPLELCDSPSGIMTQIDNMSVGIFDDMNKLTEENAAKGARIAELDEMLSVAEKLISTNMQVFEYLSGDNRETMGAITEKMQAFDAYLVNHAYLTKGGD